MRFVTKQDVSEHVSLPVFMVWWASIGLRAAPSTALVLVVGGSPGWKEICTQPRLCVAPRQLSFSVKVAA